ncbi:winged helix DNA-binding protein [Sphingomonas phyllosphaerae]|uniref:winged helix DNA-binding protein n=1 Tax=Sphingomonas phyllosphaerae TaxID=257003 RepID=UPI0004090DD7|nr:winged helix DNA-binding protein [Sphingomonas phyllosphaerae]
MATPFGFAGGRMTAFVLVTMDAVGGAAAQEAIALIGGELDTPIALQQATTVLATLPEPAPVMVLDLDGAPDEVAHDVVAVAGMLAQARAWRCVVAMSVAQIDLVIAALGDAADEVQLLCAPSPAEWIGALAIAAARGPGAVRAADEERERLARLSAEVARIAEMLTRFTEREGSDRAEDRRRAFAPAPASADITAGAVRDVLRARRLRDRFFGDGLFEDPAWDMLLDLFAAQLEGARVSVSSLCIAAAVAPTTALRWIGKLTAARLLDRAPDPEDRRRAFVALTDEARGAMHRYVAALAEARLPFV